MNSVGKKLILTTFGESHGAGIGGVIDGFPSGVKIDFDFIQNELDKRKPGQKFATKRKESDKIEILSGIFDGISTGTPIGFFVKNENQHSKDYENLKEIFRPSHADFTYFKKFGIRDYKGGGRSSARESIARVAGGAFCQLLLDNFQIKIQSGILGIGKTILDEKDADFDFAKNSEIFSLSKDLEENFKNEIINAQNSLDSVGGVVLTKISCPFTGLGEVLYDKFDARIASYFMGINAVKAVEIGAGIKSSMMKGSDFNDEISKVGFLSNNSGGILGGLTNGDEILIKTHFKPTPSIFKSQKTINLQGDEVNFTLKGRHDPCVAVRGSVVTTAMARLLVADFLLLNTSSTLTNLKKVYDVFCR